MLILVEGIIAEWLDNHIVNSIPPNHHVVLIVDRHGLHIVFNLAKKCFKVE